MIEIGTVQAVIAVLTFIVTAGGAALGAVHKINGLVKSTADGLREQMMDNRRHYDISHREVLVRIDAIDKDLQGYKLMSANHFATKGEMIASIQPFIEEMRGLRTDLKDGIDRLNGRMDTLDERWFSSTRPKLTE